MAEEHDRVPEIERGDIPDDEAVTWLLAEVKRLRQLVPNELDRTPPPKPFPEDF